LLADSYQRLAARQVDTNQPELVVELEVLAPVGHGWTEPVATTVLTSQTPSVSVGDRLGLRLVRDPKATSFNGTLVSVRGGERWLTYAYRLQDRTIVPEDGTRRTPPDLDGRSTVQTRDVPSMRPSAVPGSEFGFCF
jgi:hypothetical protein